MRFGESFGLATVSLSAGASAIGDQRGFVSAEGCSFRCGAVVSGFGGGAFLVSAAGMGLGLGSGTLSGFADREATAAFGFGAGCAAAIAAAEAMARGMSLATLAVSEGDVASWLGNDEAATSAAATMAALALSLVPAVVAGSPRSLGRIGSDVGAAEVSADETGCPATRARGSMSLGSDVGPGTVPADATACSTAGA